MKYEELKTFKKAVAEPRMKQIFANTEIPKGMVYINELGVSFLDGRSCGFETRIVASGYEYKDGKVCEYCYDELDVSFDEFVRLHKNAVFSADGDFKVEDELDNLSVRTNIGNHSRCAVLFPDLTVAKELNIESRSLEGLKMEALYADKVSLDEKISEANMQKESDLSKDELNLIKKSLDLMGDIAADKEGYSSGEKYWTLKEKLEGFEKDASKDKER